MENILEKIKVFIKTNDWGDAKKLDKSTFVEKDMGITGMDAFDFINDYAKEFNVDVSELQIDKYFYSEGGIDLINPILNLFKEENKVNINPLDITLGHLAEAAKKGKLI